MTQFYNDGIDRFIKQVQTARDVNSKEIRMSIADAESLALGLVALLSHERVLSQKLIEVQEKIIANATETPTSMDLSGGSFR